MKSVVVIQGGTSAEREISLRSGAAITNALKTKGYPVFCFDPKTDKLSELMTQKIDAVFIALHGKHGEDGEIQGCLEFLKIPYTGSNVLASALCYDKILTQIFLAQFEIPMPSLSSFKFSYWKERGWNQKGFRFPLIVKPSREGSTFGITVVHKPERLDAAIEEAAKFCEDILIEEYIQGKEMTVGLLNGKALPVVEICPQSGFFDFEAKYTKGKTEYYTPARIPEKISDHLKILSEKIFEVMGLSGAPRVDFMLDESDRPYFLEVNTIPGMTETSLLPKAAKAQGISFEDLCEEILKAAILNEKTKK